MRLFRGIFSCETKKQQGLNKTAVYCLIQPFNNDLKSY